MKRKILFICTANQMRSRTAEEMYRSDPRFEVASAGTASFATREVDGSLVKWADLVVVMEEHHRERILRRFPKAAEKIICLHIPDIYYFMDPVLKKKIMKKFEKIIRNTV